MFDGNERLVVRNRRYAEMYQLPDYIARPGTTLNGLREYRAAHGTFSRAIDGYGVELKASMEGGKTRSTEVKSADGRRQSADMLSTSEAVEAAADELRREVEGFLASVAT